VREISWSNNVVIMEKCKDELQREFYIQMTKRYGWTKRVLTNFVEAQTYEKYLLNCRRNIQNMSWKCNYI